MSCTYTCTSTRRIIHVLAPGPLRSPLRFIDIDIQQLQLTCRGWHPEGQRVKRQTAEHHSSFLAIFVHLADVTQQRVFAVILLPDSHLNFVQSKTFTHEQHISLVDAILRQIEREIGEFLAGDGLGGGVQTPVNVDAAVDVL